MAYSALWTNHPEDMETKKSSRCPSLSECLQQSSTFNEIVTVTEASRRQWIFKNYTMFSSE